MCALVIVSSVVNVFDEMMNSVSAGSRSSDGLGEVRAVDVGDEAERQVAVAVVPQRLVGHHRPEVRAADADVDDVADPLAGVTASSRRCGPGWRRRPSCRAPRARRARRSCHRRRSTASSRRAQRHVQHGAVFRNVDLLAAEHRVDLRAQARCLGESQQQPQRLVGDAVLRIVEEDAGRFGVEALAAAGSCAERVRAGACRGSCRMRFERRPRGLIRRLGHGRRFRARVRCLRRSRAESGDHCAPETLPASLRLRFPQERQEDELVARPDRSAPPRPHD